MTDRIVTIPNLLSVIRLLLVPVFLWLVLGPEQDELALLVLMFAGVTDYLDGKLARRLNQTSTVGAILDPVADRLFILAVVYGLWMRDIIPWWVALILPLRDVFLFSLVPFLRTRGYSSLPVHFLGKAATAGLLYAFPLLLLGDGEGTIADLADVFGWAFAIWGVGLYWWGGVLYAFQVRRLMATTPRVAARSMSSPPGSGQSWSGRGLLEQISDSALDDDYYVFRGSETRRSRKATLVVGLLVTLFTLFVTTAAVQTRNDRPATELERRTLAADIEERQETLDERRAVAAGLSAEVQSLQRVGDDDPEASADLDLIAAASAVSGPGLVITAEGSRAGDEAGRITDRDLQVLVNGLWYAGAEAISVNDNRVGTLTSIRTAGDAITVNYRSIGPPYSIVALGDSESLRTRFAQNQAGAYWEDRSERSGVQFTMTPSSDVALPAVPDKKLDLKHATSLEEDR